MITKICEHCGKEFSVYPQRAKQRFCSRSCYYEHETSLKIVAAEKRVTEFDFSKVVDVREMSGSIPHEYSRIPGVYCRTIVCYDP